MPKSSIALAEVIKKLRRSRGLTQVELASALGVTPTSIHRYEAGTSNPGIGVLRDLFAFASQHRELLAERDLLEKALQQRTAGTKPAEAEMEALFAINKRHSLPPLRRALLDVNVLVSLSRTEHDILEAALAVSRGKDMTAKRVLQALLEPWLPNADDDSTPGA